jgi:hypothetical protein
MRGAQAGLGVEISIQLALPTALASISRSLRADTIATISGVTIRSERSGAQVAIR